MTLSDLVIIDGEACPVTSLSIAGDDVLAASVLHDGQIVELDPAQIRQARKVCIAGTDLFRLTLLPGSRVS